jgi:hypothetical protein
VSKLVNGLIPAGMTCPYSVAECIDSCPCKGKKHTVDYSCAAARGLDLAEPESAFIPPESEDPWEYYQEKHSRPARHGVKKFRERNCC